MFKKRILDISWKSRDSWIVDNVHWRCCSAWASAHRGKWGQLTPLGKMDEKLKNENVQKEQFSTFMLYFESNQGRQVYSSILQNAPFRSQIFIIFFASGGRGALTPLTKILRTFLLVSLA